MQSNLTWKLLHTLACKINEKKYIENKTKIHNFLENIFNELKCIYCKVHAKKYFSDNPNIGDTKDELIHYIFWFHTKVNIKLNKKYYPKSNLIEYENYDIFEINDKWLNNTPESGDYTKNFIKNNKDLFI